jgi:hypothetical protein
MGVMILVRGFRGVPGVRACALLLLGFMLDFLQRFHRCDERGDPSPRWA